LLLLEWGLPLAIDVRNNSITNKPITMIIEIVFIKEKEFSEII